MRFVRRGQEALVLGALLLASSCATIKPATEFTAVPGDLKTWRASGRIAVSGADGGGSGSFVWQQRDSAAEVSLRGPVGIGGMNVFITDQSLRVTTSDGKELDADDARAELAVRLGASIPTQDLRFWMIGRPAIGEHEWLSESTPNAQAAQSTVLIQHGWRIDFQRFGDIAGLRLPTKMQAASGAAKVRIVIDTWTLR